MARWQPDSRQRLEAAALDLYLQYGYEQTTVAEIAGRAGLTERTYFRHFGDKREVLFAGQQEFRQPFLDGVRAAPDGSGALGLALAGLRSAAAFFSAERRDHARRRQQVIEANPALQERELHKLATLAADLAGALQSRGVDPAEAGLVAEVAVGIFRAAFGRWISQDRPAGFAELLTEDIDRLVRAVESESASGSGSRGDEPASG